MYNIEKLVNELFVENSMDVYCFCALMDLDVRLDKIGLCGKITGIYDNNEYLHGCEVKGIPVLPPCEINKGNGVIIVMGAYRHIRKQLLDLRLEEFVDFVEYDYLLLAKDCCLNNRLELPYIETYITTRCTLRCKYCSFNIPSINIKDAIDKPLDELCEDIDLLFNYVQYVPELRIVGGEPFLHCQLSDYLSYITDNYRKNIGKIKIYSNSTVVPDDNTITTLKKSKAKVYLKQYGDVFKDEGYIKIGLRIEAKLKTNDVPYCSVRGNEWWRLFHRYGGVSSDESKLVNLYLECKSICPTFQGLDGGCIYPCSIALNAYNQGKATPLPNEYFNLKHSKNPFSLSEKLRLLHIYFYGADMCLAYCSMCNGWQSKVRFPAGEQL